MAADETPEDRLEAALERIARVVGGSSGVSGSASELNGAGAEEVAVRLDRIIATLRDALDK